MKSIKIWTLIFGLLNSSIFELTITEKSTKSIEFFVEDWPSTALRIYISTPIEHNRCEIASKRKLFAELRGEFAIFDGVKIVQLILRKKRTKSDGEFVCLKATTKFILANDQFILNGNLYPLGLNSELSAGCITFQLVKGNGKRRIEHFELELREFEQLNDNLILLKVRLVQRKGKS